MPDEDLSAAALEALEAVLIVMIEDAQEVAVASAPDSVGAHRDRIDRLRRVGANIVTLSEACAVLLPRAE